LLVFHPSGSRDNPSLRVLKAASYLDKQTFSNKKQALRLKPKGSIPAMNFTYRDKLANQLLVSLTKAKFKDF
jgi:hypothetical protein